MSSGAPAVSCDPALKRLLNSPDFDPRSAFPVRSEDQAIGPMASAHFGAGRAPIKEGEERDEHGFVPAASRSCRMGMGWKCCRRGL